jgi:hypothetical protein
VNRAGAGRDASSRGGFERPRAPRLRIDEISSDRMGTERGAPESRPKRRPGADRASGPRGGVEPGRSERPRFDRTRFDRQDAGRTGGYRREGGGGPSHGRDAAHSSAPRPSGKTPGWKPRANFGGQGRTESGERPKRGPGSGSRSGGFSRSGSYGERPTGGTGHRVGGTRPSGARSGRTGTSGSRPSGKRGGAPRRKDRG